MYATGLSRNTMVEIYGRAALNRVLMDALRLLIKTGIACNGKLMLLVPRLQTFR